MEKQNFKIREGENYVELISLLKVLQIAQTGGHAKMIVEEGSIKVNSELEFRKRKKLVAGDVVEMGALQITITA